ncbi:MAG: sodium:solute symporter [Bacteroidetes bacterium]|nr:sodium:solute symporter [Bacteroidota bacterium]MDA0888377.1 sodium:solute symporter [Bacteroidota bacterium]MDA1084437.1 sodium:solute symporter [Bacteroidota bacterium]
MSAQSLGLCLLMYFGVLYGISKWVGKSNSNATFFAANKKAPWYLVAFGMIGASLSGLTFVSVPGWVASTQLGYVQMVLGYALGYVFIGTILLPLYYKWNVISIYSYLRHRFGIRTYKTGASFFILSRLTGTSFRMFLVLKVLHWIALDDLLIPFWASAAVTIIGIWLYTQKTGIKTIIYTDTVQTIFMLLALFVGVFVLVEALQLDVASLGTWWQAQPTTQMFFWEDWNSGQHVIKQFFAGALISFAMTGLDQEMMQKNLSCRSLRDAQKNMFWFTIALVVVTLLFLVLGVLLTAYAQAHGITASGDNLFPMVATQSGLGKLFAYTFVFGLIAAAFSSADSSMTSLATSASIDLWEIHDDESGVKQRKLMHRIMAAALWCCMVVFNYVIRNESVIAQLLLFAGYTYGPLLGLFLLGIFSKRSLRDAYVPIICIATPAITYGIATLSKTHFDYDFGFFVLALNGALSALFLWISGIGLPMYQGASPSKSTSKSS